MIKHLRIALQEMIFQANAEDNYDEYEDDFEVGYLVHVFECERIF